MNMTHRNSSSVTNGYTLINLSLYNTCEAKWMPFNLRHTMCVYTRYVWMEQIINGPFIKHKWMGTFSQ